MERVAYVDIDVHHGDGVQAAFYDDPRVLTVSLHESPLTLWPGTGWPAETGRGPAAGTAVNIPVPAGTGNAGWLRAFHAVVPGVVRRSGPRCWSPSTVPTPMRGSAGRPERDGRRAPGRLLTRCATWPRASPAGAGWRSAAAGMRWSGWSRGPGRTCWRRFSGATSTRGRPVPPGWAARGRAARPGVPPPIDMTDGEPGRVDFRPWDGSSELAVDRAISEVRRSVYPLHGLDPYDPRD